MQKYHFIVLVAIVAKTSCDNLDYPYTVSLRRGSSWDNWFLHFCTGSIIAPKWVLTAGHCFSKKKYVPLKHLRVYAGTEYLSDGVPYNIAAFYIHPNESESQQIYKNDICLVELETPVVYPIVPLGTINDQDEVPVISIGWGRDVAIGELRKKRHVTEFKTMRYDQCQKMHAERDNLVDESFHICGFSESGTSLCFGDSGGPLIDPKSGNQVALFSSMEDCSGKYPLLFEKIEPFIGWIRYVTGINFELH